jgi:hypothetical protein
VPEGVRQRPVAEVLEPVVTWEDGLRHNMTRTRIVRDPSEVRIRWCRLVRRCRQPGRWWPDP